MVMGVPPLSMVGRHETATLATHSCGYISRSEPPRASLGAAL
jgi:hypothetical protein